MHVTVTWSKQRSSWGWLVRENFQETLVPGTTDYDVSIKSEIIVHCRHFKGTYISEDFLNALPNLLTLSNTTYSSTNIYQKPADFQVFLLLHLSSSVQKQENPSRLFQTLKKTKSLTLTSVISPVNWHLASSFREKKNMLFGCIFSDWLLSSLLKYPWFSKYCLFLYIIPTCLLPRPMRPGKLIIQINYLSWP